MNEKVPAHLKHKPILKVDDYSDIDGHYSHDTDTRGLSIGLAQWNNDNESDISAKTWRFVNGRWSRLSEELPLHRVLDLAFLICAAVDYTRTGNLSSLQDKPIQEDNNNPNLEAHLHTLKEELQKQMGTGVFGDGLDGRLKRLSAELKKIGY